MGIKEQASNLNLLFKGLTRAYGKMTLTDEYSETTGKRIAKHAFLQDRPVDVDLWIKHLKGDSIGIVPIQDDGVKVQFGAIDVDVYKDFNHFDLLKKIQKYKLPLVVLKSKSGGAHCYCFTEEPVPAAVMQRKLTEWAAVLGISRIDGKNVEVFPKQTKLLLDRNDMGSFINMPYDGGDKSLRKALIINQDKQELKQLELDDFIIYAKTMRVTPKDLINFEIETFNYQDPLPGGPPCLNQILLEGVKQGNRNVVAAGVCTYAKMAYPDTWETFVENIVAKYFDDPLPSKELQAIIKSAAKKDYMYQCDTAPLSNHCDKSKCKQCKFGVGTNIGYLPNIQAMLQLMTSPPTYFVSVEGKDGRSARIEVTSDELFNFKKMTAIVFDRTGIVMGSVKDSEWRQYISEASEKMTQATPPKETTTEGLMIEYLEDYLLNNHQAQDRGLIDVGRPWKDKNTNKIYFKLVDFMDFLKRKNFKEHRSLRDLAVALRRLEDKDKVIHKQLNVSGSTRNVWGYSDKFVTERVKVTTENLPANIEDEELF